MRHILFPLKQGERHVDFSAFESNEKFPNNRNTNPTSGLGRHQGSLNFSAGRLSPELFDLFLRWLGRRKEEPQICLLFWLAAYNPPLFHLILGVRRYLLAPLQLIK